MAAERAGARLWRREAPLQPPPPRPRRGSLRIATGALAGAALAVSIGLGALAGRFSAPVVHDRYFPWLAGRALGLATFACLFALVAAGLWMRHPWRSRFAVVHPETLLRLHAALASATVVLLGGHLSFLAGDRYAGVGVVGALVPGLSSYRTVPVALGTAAAWSLVLVAASARLAPRLLGRGWLRLHQLAAPIFVASFFHGVLAGTDTARLRLAYAAAGLLLAAMWLSRHLATARIPTRLQPKEVP